MGTHSIFDLLLKCGIEGKELKEKEALKKKKRDQELIIKTFRTYENFIVYLADASAKERQLLLKNWQTENAKSQTGRKKINKYNREYLFWFLYLKARYQHDLGRKLSDRQTLEHYYKTEHPEKPIGDWRQGFKTIENALTRLRKELNSSQ